MNIKNQIPKEHEITENTITLAIDLQGGLCDRLMLGKQGIINNANASLECWKYNAPDDEDIQELKELQYPQDIEHALNILYTDNFDIAIVTSTEQIKELLQDNEIEIDLNNIKFENNIYKIY